MEHDWLLIQALGLILRVILLLIQGKPSFRKAMGDILDGVLRHRKRLGNRAFVPAISQFRVAIQARVRVRAFALP